MLKRLQSLKKSIKKVAGSVGRRLSLRPKKSKLTPKPAQPDKKILMFGWELPPFNSGGLGVACYELAQSIAKRNTAITFVLPKRQDIDVPFMDVAFADSAKYPDSAGSLAVHQIETPLTPYLKEAQYRTTLAGYRRLFPSKRKYGSDLIGEVYRYGDRAARVAKKENFDVIHVHDWLSFPAGIMAKKATKKPLVAHVHSIEYDRCHASGVDPNICAIEKEGMEKADRVIAISRYVKDRIMRYYGIDERKIEVVHNGINLDKFGRKRVGLKSLKSGGYKIVLFTGRITYQKGVDYLIKAAHKALKFNPKINFMIVGSGDMQRQIITEAARLGISDRVFFPGFLRGADLETIYRAADVYVMPSVSEPFGLVALEALSNKVPVILSKQSGVAEVVEHALKINFWDTDELANKIVAVLKNPSLRKVLSENGYENVQRCTWDSAADKCVNIYGSLVAA